MADKPQQDSNPPQAISDEIMQVGDIKIRCHVLEDGRRVIEQDDLMRVLDWMGIPDLGDAAEQAT